MSSPRLKIALAIALSACFTHLGTVATVGKNLDVAVDSTWRSDGSSPEPLSVSPVRSAKRGTRDAGSRASHPFMVGLKVSQCEEVHTWVRNTRAMLVRGERSSHSMGMHLAFHGGPDGAS